VADGAVLAGGVTSLEDNEERSTIFRVQKVLEVAELIGQLTKTLLGLVAIQALGFEVGVDLFEIDLGARLDTEFPGITHPKPRRSIPWSVIDQVLLRWRVEDQRWSKPKVENFCSRESRN
jgi:hypothetical protein